MEESIAGRGGLAMLVGEPGIGKTRTAQELASYAEGRGAQVLWGRCYEEEGAPPYWPWVQAIRSYVEPRNTDQLQTALGPSAADIAEIVPEIRRKLTGLETPPDLPPEQARFRLFDSITSFLKTSARSQPLMLVLDDLHWADEPSLLLLQFLAQQLADSSILVVGCYRDGELSRQHPLSETLARISREAVYQRHALRRMDHDDTAHYIEVAAGTNVSPTVVEAIYARIEGNPFITTEVVQLLSDRGELAQESDRGPSEIRIPEGVREVIGQRFSRLSDDCNLVLSTAAVIGREFTLDLLDRLIEDLTGDRLMEVLEELLAASLIEELPPSVGRYQFTHALIAETLEELYGPEVEIHAAELVYHFAQAEAVTGSVKLVRYSLLAGDGALKVRAYEEAFTHFQRGLTAKGVALTGREPAEDEEAAVLLSGFGHAQMGIVERANLSQVADTFVRAFNYFVDAGDSERAVSVALAEIRAATVREMIERALTLVPPDSHDAGKLQARQISANRADYDKAQGAFQRAFSIARQQQDQSLEMQALVASACVDFHHGHNEQSLERNLRVIELSHLVDMPYEETHAHYDLFHVLYAMGDSDQATHHAETMVASAERARIRIWRSRAMEAHEALGSAKGDWQTAREFAEQGLKISPLEHTLIGARALLEYQLGETEAGDTYLNILFENFRAGAFDSTNQANYTVPAIMIPMVSYITGIAVRFEFVEDIARSIFSSPDANPSAAVAARVGLALIAAQRGDETAAKELYGAL